MARIMQAMESVKPNRPRRSARPPGWQFWIDRGGTFTDVIGLAPDGALHVRKVLSLAAGDRARADPGTRGGARACCAAIAARRAGTPTVKVGTTVATNALLERTGEPVVLVTTAGFARWAAHRLPESPRHLRAPHRAA